MAEETKDMNKNDRCVEKSYPFKNGFVLMVDGTGKVVIEDAKRYFDDDVKQEITDEEFTMIIKELAENVKKQEVVELVKQEIVKILTGGGE